MLFPNRIFPRRRDFFVGLALMALSISGLLYIYLVDGAVADIMDPNAFPGIVLICIAALSLLLTLIALFKTHYVAGKEVISARVFLPIVIIAVYTLLFNTAGFLLSSMLVMAALMLHMGERSLKIILVTAIATPIILKLAGEWGLNIIFP